MHRLEEGVRRHHGLVPLGSDGPERVPQHGLEPEHCKVQFNSHPFKLFDNAEYQRFTTKAKYYNGDDKIETNEWVVYVADEVGADRWVDSGTKLANIPDGDYVKFAFVGSRMS